MNPSTPGCKKFSRIAVRAGVLLCLAGVSLHATASDARASREREALRRVQQQLAAVQTQIATLEQDKTQLADALAQSQSARKAAEGRNAGLSREVGSAKQAQSSLAQQLAAARTEAATTMQQLTDTRKTLADTTLSLQQATAEKNALSEIRTRNEREIGACEGRNMALYKLGRELMQRFEAKSCGEILAEKEPFTGLKKVETENLLETYRDKLDAQKLVKPPGE
jgi:chromosome segregation ATPase